MPATATPASAASVAVVCAWVAAAAGRGRALAGLRTAVERGEVRPGERTVFVHTGGLPGLFGHDEMVASQS